MQRVFTDRGQIHGYCSLAAVTVCALTMRSSKQALQIFGTTTLIGISTGIATCLLNKRACPSFSNNTIYTNNASRAILPKLLEAKSPTLNAIARGVALSWHVSMVAGLIFGFAARVPSYTSWFATKIPTSHIKEALLLKAALAVAIGHIGAHLEWRSRERNILDGIPTTYPNTVPQGMRTLLHTCEMRLGVTAGSLAISFITLYLSLIVARTNRIRLTRLSTCLDLTCISITAFFCHEELLKALKNTPLETAESIIQVIEKKIQEERENLPNDIQAIDLTELRPALYQAIKREQAFQQRRFSPDFIWTALLQRIRTATNAEIMEHDALTFVTGGVSAILQNGQ